MGWEYSCCNTSLLSKYANIALQLHRHEYSWVVKKETLQRQYSGLNIPLGHHTDRGPIGLGQDNSLGEYCGPHTASSVFLIIKLTEDN